MPDTLTVIRGATSPTERGSSERFIAGNNRARMGLAPHTEAFERFIKDQADYEADLERPMLGVAVSRYRLWPRLAELDEE